MTKLALHIFWLLLLLLFAAQVEAETRTVASSCSGQPSPCYTTIQAAADDTTAGDIVDVRGGSYAGFNVTNSGSAGSYITYRAHAGETVNINSGPINCWLNEGIDTIVCLQDKSYIALDGLVFDGATASETSLQLSNSHHINVLNSEIKNGPGTGLAIYNFSHDITVQYSSVHDNTTANIELSGQYRLGNKYPSVDWGAGLYVHESCYAIDVNHNHIYWNHGEGVYAGYNSNISYNVISDSWGTNVYVLNHDVRVDHNLIYQTLDAKNYPAVIDPDTGQEWLWWNKGASGISVSGEGGVRDSSNVEIFDNVIVDDGMGIDNFWLTSITNNKIYNNTLVNTGGIKFTNSLGSISGLEVRNNIVYGLDSFWSGDWGFLNFMGATGGTISNNVYYATNPRWGWGGYTSNFATWTSSSGDSNSLTSDPQLVNPSVVPCRAWVDPRGQLGAPCSLATIQASVTNYKIQNVSLAKDRGFALGSNYATDFNGGLRPFGDGWDIGALEYGSGPIPPPIPPTPALVLAMPFDAGDGNTAVDISGFNNNGLFGTGVNWDNSGKYGKALSFDGTGGITIQPSSSLDLITGFTLEAWVYVTSTSATFKPIVIRQRPDGTDEQYSMYVSSETWLCPNGWAFSQTINPGIDNSRDLTACDISNFPTNQWVHLAATYSGVGTSLFLYRNGQLVSSIIPPGTPATSSGSVYIGLTAWNEYFTGKLDEVRIYNYARTQAEIQTDMATPLTPSGPTAVVKIGAGTSLKFSATNGALKVGQ